MSTPYQPIAECGVIDDARAADYHRRWLVANDAGQWLTRELSPRLADVTVELRLGYLVIRAPGMLRLDVPLDVIEDDDSVRFTVKIGDQAVDVVDEGELAAAWMSNVVGRTCGLMKIHPDAPPVAWPR